VFPWSIALKECDETRKAIKELKGMIDTQAVIAIWEKALRTPKWSKPPVWMHGDLSPGN
jgi:aminoglycoside phosphotransferase (APT) family kinase protein